MKTEKVNFQREAQAILAHKYIHFPTVYKKKKKKNQKNRIRIDWKLRKLWAFKDSNPSGVLKQSKMPGAVSVSILESVAVKRLIPLKTMFRCQQHICQGEGVFHIQLK